MNDQNETQFTLDKCSPDDVVSIEWDRGHATLNASVVAYDVVDGLLGSELHDGQIVGRFWMCSDEITAASLLEDDDMDVQMERIRRGDPNSVDSMPPTSDFESFLSHAVGSLIAFYRRTVGSTRFTCGYLLGMSNSEIFFLDIDPKGQVQTGPHRATRDDLAKVEVGTTYLKSLHIVAEVAHLAT
jgi:hypothetical protein